MSVLVMFIMKISVKFVKQDISYLLMQLHVLHSHKVFMVVRLIETKLNVCNVCQTFISKMKFVFKLLMKLPIVQFMMMKMCVWDVKKVLFSLTTLVNKLKLLFVLLMKILILVQVVLLVIHLRLKVIKRIVLLLQFKIV